MPTLYIIRGLPGSGKSTLAQKLLDTKVIQSFFEADMFFFMNDEGRYIFQPSLIKHAHEWCQKQVNDAMHYSDDVAVSNTFTTKWEMQPYLDMAKKYQYNVETIVCRESYGSIHNVPNEAIARMKARWEE